MGKRLRSKKVVAGSLLLGIAAILLIIWWLNSSNQGSIKNGSASPEAAKEIAGDKVLDTANIRLTYKGAYIAQQLPAKDNDIELYKLTADTNYKKDFVVAVSNLPQGSLDQNSGYLLRKTRTDLYSQFNIAYVGGTASAWARSDGQEITVFIQKGAKVAVLAFVQANPTAQNLRQEVEAAVHSFAWK